MMPDPDLEAAIAGVESNNNSNARSGKGAMGRMQVMPANAEHFAPGEDPYDDETNLKIARGLINEEYQRYNGDMRLTLAAYNAGSPKINKAIKEAGSTNFDDLIPHLEKMGLHETVNYVPKVLSRYDAIKGGKREEIAAEKKQSYLDPWGTTDEFQQSVQDVTTQPDFAELPVPQQIEKIDKIYSSRKWVEETEPMLASVTEALWKKAPDQTPDWEHIIGPAIDGNTEEEVTKSAHENRDIFKEKLRSQGTEPALFGNQIDNYFDTLAQNETDRLAAKNRTWLGLIGVDAEEVARGGMQGFASAAAAVPDLLGYEDTGKTIRDYPSKLIRPNRDANFEVDEQGNIARDENGLPITKMRGAIFSGIGQMGSLLLGGGSLRAAGVGVKGIATLFGGVNTLGLMDGAYSEAREEGASRGDALQASALVVPAALIDSAVEASIFGNGQFWMKGLTGANRGRAVAQSMLSAALKAGSVGALQEDVQQRAVGAYTGKEYDPGRTLTAAVAGGIAGGMVGGLEGLHYQGEPPAVKEPYKESIVDRWQDPEKVVAPSGKIEDPEKIIQPSLPNPHDQVGITGDFERLQRSTDSETELKLPAGEEVPPQLLKLFAFDATRISDDKVRITRQTTYERPAIDENNIDAIDAHIQTLAKRISKSPDLEDAGDLILRRGELKSEYAKLAEKIPKGADNVEELVNSLSETQQKIDDNRLERKRVPDKIVQQVLDVEHGELQTQLAETQKALAKDPIKKRAVEIRQEISDINGKMKDLAGGGVYANDISAMDAHLKELVRKRGELKESQQGGKIHAEKFKESAIKVDTPTGEKFLLPVKGDWYVVDGKGRVTAKGGPFLRDAYRVAHSEERPTAPPAAANQPAKGAPNGTLGFDAPGATPNGKQTFSQKGMGSSKEQIREAPSAASLKWRRAFDRHFKSEPNKPVGPEFITARAITETGSPRSVAKTKKLANAALASLKGLAKNQATFSEGGPFKPNRMGYYAFNKEFTRIQRINDPIIAAHEITHVIDKYTFGKWDSKGLSDYDLLPPKVKQGLIETAETFYPSPDIPADIKVPEGFSMFVQHLVSGQPVHKEVLSWFHKDFAAAYPKEYKALNRFVDATFEFYNQTPENFVKSVRSAKEPSLAAKLLLGRNTFKRDYIDLAVALDEVDKLGGTNLKDVHDARRNSSAFYAEGIMNGQISDLNGNVLSEKSLGATLKPVIDAGKKDILSNYMTSQRAISYNQAGLDPGIPLKDAFSVILDAQRYHPDVIKAANDFWQQWTVLQDALSRDSVTARDYFDGIKRVNLAETGTEHGYYVPFQREGKGRIQLGTERKGSARRIADPLTQIQSVVQGLAEAVSRRNIMEQLINAANDPMNRSGAYVREVTDNVTKKALNTELAAKKQSTFEALDKFGGEVDTTTNEAMNSAIGFLDPKFNHTKASNGFVFLAVPDRTNFGKMRYYEVAESVYRVFNNKLPEWTSAPLFRAAVVGPKEFVKAGATTLRPAFALTNLGRDFLTAYRRSQDWNPVTFGRDVLQGLSQSLQSTMGIKNLHNWVALAERMGLQGSNRFNLDTQEQLAGESSWKRHPIKKLEDFISISERGLRTAALIAKARELGVTPDSELSAAQAVELALAYKRSTTDFAIQGEKTRVMNMAVPFFTARIAESVQMAQDFKRNPAKIVAVGTAWATFGMMYALAHKDDDWYKEMKADELGRFVYIPWEKEGQKVLLRVPLDSWGQLMFTLGQGVSAGADRRGGELRKGAGAFAAAIIKGNSPFGTPVDNKYNFIAGSAAELGGPLFKEAMQQYANRDFYFDKPIVPRGLEQAAVKDQTTQATSATAKFLADMVGWSPTRVDHLIRSTSAVASDAIRVGEDITGVKPEKGMSGITDHVMGPFYRYGAINSIFDTSSEKFYDDVAKFQANEGEETPKEKIARRKLNDARERVGAINTLLQVDSLTEAEKNELQDKKRALFAEARQIAGGDTGQALTSAPKKQAEQVKKEKRRAVSGKRETKDQEIFDKTPG